MFIYGGRMRSFIPVLIILLLLSGTAIFAQDLSTELPDQDGSLMAARQFNSFEKGDGILSLSLGAVFPLGFYHFDSGSFMKANSYPGFAFTISYAGFIMPNWAIEGEFAGGFIGSQNKDTLFVAPISVRMARYFPIGSFAIAPSAGLGMAISSIGGYKHIDALAKLGSSFLWKANADMSYSFKLFANFIPQFFKNSEQSMLGFFLETTLSVAYHM